MNPLKKYEHPIGKYAFHTTQQDTTDAIRQQGIKPTEATNYDTGLIETILTELGYDDPFPFDRTEVTYCHVDSEYVAEYLPSQTDSSLFPGDVAVVVDVDTVTAPMYIADMSHISDLREYRLVGSHMMIQSDTPEEAIEQYRDSITKVETPSDIAACVDDGINHAELIVDGDIPPAAIADTVL